MTHIISSDHAEVRAQQRGIRPATIEFVLQHADIDLEAGNGCYSCRLSHRAAAELLRKGAPISEVDKARSVVLIISKDSGEIVTVMHDRNSDGRRYRRQWPTWTQPSKKYAQAA